MSEIPPASPNGAEGEEARRHDQRVLDTQDQALGILREAFTSNAQQLLGILDWGDSSEVLEHPVPTPRFTYEGHRIVTPDLVEISLTATKRSWLRRADDPVSTGVVFFRPSRTYRGERRPKIQHVTVDRTGELLIHDSDTSFELAKREAIRFAKDQKGKR